MGSNDRINAVQGTTSTQGYDLKELSRHYYNGPSRSSAAYPIDFNKRNGVVPKMKRQLIFGN